MSDLIEATRKNVEHLTQHLSGDADFTPFLALGRGDDVTVAMLSMPNDAEGKESVSEIIAAMCMIQRAEEAVLASAAWMVASTEPLAVGMTPSEHPDRAEIVFLLHVKADGGIDLHTAPLIRDNNMVGVGLWQVDPQSQMGGHFAEAMIRGMGMSKILPPDVIKFIDDQMGEGNMEFAIKFVASAYREARRRAEATWLAQKSQQN